MDGALVQASAAVGGILIAALAYLVRTWMESLRDRLERLEREFSAYKVEVAARMMPRDESTAQAAKLEAKLDNLAAKFDALAQKLLGKD